MPRQKSGPPEGPQPRPAKSPEETPRIFSEHLKSQGFRPLVDEQGKLLTSNLDPLPKGQWNTYFFFTRTVPHWVTVVCDEEGKLWTKHSARVDDDVVLKGSSNYGFKKTEFGSKDWGTSVPIKGEWLLDISPYERSRDGEFVFNAYLSGVYRNLDAKAIEQIISKLEGLTKNPAFSDSRELSDAIADLTAKLSS